MTSTRRTRITSCGLLAACLLVFTPTSARAQDRPFVYTTVPALGGTFRSAFFGDLGFGRRLFSGLGPEQLEHRLGLQLALGARTRLDAQGGWAPFDDDSERRFGGHVELLRRVTTVASPALFALGAGVSQEYTRRAAITGRVIAGYQFARTLAVANLRLERPLSSGAASEARRDALDVITTLGVSRELAGGLRVGLEALGEDLEGFVDSEEAEGGARLMVGPSVSVAPPRSPWTFALTLGPVIRATRSTVDGSTSGASRELTQSSGFVVRSAFGFRW